MADSFGKRIKGYLKIMESGLVLRNGSFYRF
ncbi:hypothetical protein WSI_02705 [Candidatus Liberibacter asiaticus str. gxpsy]|uniref:Uncharacterized protein n=2 Tax=Liberibacter asiaticus TaxID=34021 RepID=C6XFH1_LIBAP|nr:hypothetical protein CLIBASIA_02690 [Candidatus Liberibacter asiaticus str. psy62]AGH16911.1 hypothetical protein WSI_02705 [Candidatus Liberibacter asiaticus str. gxpsy]BAP26432.1 hypothetical protein CGUJ_02695 [Candidatus Liberibacter asiaticus str. Ishi-1]